MRQPAVERGSFATCYVTTNVEFDHALNRCLAEPALCVWTHLRISGIFSNDLRERYGIPTRAAYLEPERSTWLKGVPSLRT